MYVKDETSTTISSRFECKDATNSKSISQNKTLLPVMSYFVCVSILYPSLLQLILLQIL